MLKQPLSRWQQFYQDDPKLADIHPSTCARWAAGIFAANNCHLVLDLGCGAARDSVHLADSGLRVIGLDAARSGLLLAKKRIADLESRISFVESDSRVLPFLDVYFDGVYCFGLLHEFVGESARHDVNRTLKEIRRVLKPTGVAVIAVSAGNPEKGLPLVQNFSKAMFDAVTSESRRIEKKHYDDLGCTGWTDYKVCAGIFKNMEKNMGDCVFCRILAGELPVQFFYADERVVGFLSLDQPNPYKILIVPLKHVETVYDLNDELAGATFQAAAKIARGFRDVSKCNGINLVQSNGKAGQQDVFHFYLHIVPRFFRDSIVFNWDNTAAPQEKLSQFAQEIRTQLKADI